jgi:hypothetical protein
MKIFCAMSSGAHNHFRKNPRMRFTSQLATKNREYQSVGTACLLQAKERKKYTNIFQIG